MEICTCMYCKTKILFKESYKTTQGKNDLYFCNKEHYDAYTAKLNKDKKAKEDVKKKDQENIEKSEEERIKEEKEKERKAKRKAEKDKVYWLICEIIGRNPIINPMLYKEWKIWNKVASNKIIGQCLEDNKAFLLNKMATFDDVEYQRILYVSSVLKHKLGDYSKRAKDMQVTPIKKVEETFYEPIATNNNKRRSLADLEDDF